MDKRSQFEDLSKSAVARCSRQGDNYVNVTLQMMHTPENIGYFIEKLRDSTLTDIGGGVAGYFTLEQLMKGLRADLRDEPETPVIGIDKGIVVDPFNEPHHFGEDRIRVVKQDALSYLLSQNANSSNIMTNGIDDSILPYGDPVIAKYVKEVANEIYRVVPEGGIYVSNNSGPIEREVSKLFKKISEFGRPWFKPVKTFEK